MFIRACTFMQRFMNGFLLGGKITGAYMSQLSYTTTKPKQRHLTHLYYSQLHSLNFFLPLQLFSFTFL
jgi:hypothetical protein